MSRIPIKKMRISRILRNALAGILFKRRGGAYLIAAQGSILLGWLLIQMWMIQTIYFLHIVMGLTGIGLIVIGALEAKREK